MWTSTSCPRRRFTEQTAPGRGVGGDLKVCKIGLRGSEGNTLNDASPWRCRSSWWWADGRGAGSTMLAGVSGKLWELWDTIQEDQRLI